MSGLSLVELLYPGLKGAPGQGRCGASPGGHPCRLPGGLARLGHGGAGGPPLHGLHLRPWWTPWCWPRPWRQGPRELPLDHGHPPHPVRGEAPGGPAGAGGHWAATTSPGLRSRTFTSTTRPETGERMGWASAVRSFQCRRRDGLSETFSQGRYSREDEERWPKHPSSGEKEGQTDFPEPEVVVSRSGTSAPQEVYSRRHPRGVQAEVAGFLFGLSEPQPVSFLLRVVP